MYSHFLVFYTHISHKIMDEIYPILTNFNVKLASLHYIIYIFTTKYFGCCYL